MTKYKAIVKDSLNGATSIVAAEYGSKADFILDLRLNGYKVNETKVKTAEVLDHILDNTDGEPWVFRMPEKEYRAKYMK